MKNRTTREVTLRFPEGKTQTAKLAKNSDTLKRLQPGDQVTAILTKAIAIDVTQPKKY